MAGTSFGAVKPLTEYNSRVHLSPGAAGASPVIRVMLSRLGLRKTMLIKTGIDAALLVAAYLLIKERRRPSATIVRRYRMYFTDLKFWSIGLCMCFSGFGFLVPFFYLPTFAKQKIPNLAELVSNYSVWTPTRRDTHSLWQLSALTLTALNLSSGVGRCCAGLLADLIGPTNAMFLVVLMSGLVQSLVWNFVSDYPGIVSNSYNLLTT
jgi:hypothetical protein